jgi:hypothetical protein
MQSSRASEGEGGDSNRQWKLFAEQMAIISVTRMLHNLLVHDMLFRLVLLERRTSWPM